MEDARRAVASVHRRAVRQRDRVHEERHRGAQPRRPLVGPRQPARRRRRRAHRDGAPRQHRAVAHARGRAGHRAAMATRSRRRHARPRRARPLSSTAPSSSSITAMSNVLGTLTPVRRIADAAHAAGAAVCVDACQYVPHLATDVARARRRPPGVQRPQDVRPDRHRCAVGPPRSCSTPCRRSSVAAR